VNAVLHIEPMQIVSHNTGETPVKLLSIWILHCKRNNIHNTLQFISDCLWGSRQN